MTEGNEQILPAIRYINGHAYIKVQDLAHDWHTTTSSILATGKSQQVPTKYRRTIEGRTWCDVEGLRYRLNRMKRGWIREQLRQLVDRFPKDEKHVDNGLGPQVETIHMKDGSTGTITRCFLQRVDYPSREEIQVALDNRQVIYRYKNKRVQVLAQTLSSFLDTRTSSLLAVNKKQGVPAKYIHRLWKQTWVDLEGLKQRVNHTEHGSALLKGLKQVIQCLDELSTPDDWKVESANAPKPKAKPGTKHNPIDVCEVAIEANKRAVHNTERLNKLEKARHNQLAGRVHNLEDRVAVIEAGDRQATQAMAEGKTPLDALSQRVSSLVTHTDRLDGKTDGLESRMSVLEDTSKWLSWSLAGVVGVRFLSLMLRMLKRK